ncbi:MAG: alpha/beta fold hydrolase, partial [Polyangiaceae bacterium]
MGKPFERGRFEDLPEKPRVSHSFDATKACEVTLDSKSFGKMRVAYREIGEGPPLLLVHGLMTTSYSWRYVFEPLSKKYR